MKRFSNTIPNCWRVNYTNCSGSQFTFFIENRGRLWTVGRVAQWGSQSVAPHAYNDLSLKRPIMWDEIADMPGEIFDISDETRDEMAAAWEHNEILNQIADLVFDS